MDIFGGTLVSLLHLANRNVFFRAEIIHHHHSEGIPPPVPYRTRLRYASLKWDSLIKPHVFPFYCSTCAGNTHLFTPIFPSRL